MNQQNSLSESSHFITLQKAVDFTTTFRKNQESILDPASRGKNILAFSETFDRTAFDTLLKTPDCAGVRIYYGMDSELKVHAVVVAVNSKNEDILPPVGTNVTGPGDDAVILEESTRCPDACPPPSPLNP